MNELQRNINMKQRLKIYTYEKLAKLNSKVRLFLLFSHINTKSNRILSMKQRYNMKVWVKVYNINIYSANSSSTTEVTLTFKGSHIPDSFHHRCNILHHTFYGLQDILTLDFQRQASTRDFSTQDFSITNSSTTKFSTMNL